MSFSSGEDDQQQDRPIVPIVCHVAEVAERASEKSESEDTQTDALDVSFWLTHFAKPATSPRTVPIFDFAWRWAGDRLLSPLIRSSRTESITALKSDDQITTRESVAHSSQDRMRSRLAQCAFLRDDAVSCLRRWSKPGRT
jgi:hypothetical protein